VGTFRFQRQELAGSWVGITDKPTFPDAEALAHRLADLYISERVDQVI